MNRAVQILLYIALTAALLFFLSSGWSYYLTSISDRPWHEAHTIFKPGGTTGHGLGVAGSFFMLLLLAYSLKKRTRLFQGWGTMRNWLSVHIFLGVSGPLLICLHTAAKLNGIIAVAFWAMIFVALSGFFGRFIYAQIPRSFEGREFTRDEAEARLAQIRLELKQHYQLDDEEITEIENIIQGNPQHKLTIPRLLMQGILDWFHRLKADKHKNLIQSLYKLPADKVNSLYKTIWTETSLNRQLAFWNQLHRIFYFWHVLHKPFTVIMFIIMFVHAGISIWLGYRWIF